MLGYSGFRGAGKTRALVGDIYNKFQKNPDLIIFTNTPLTFPKHKKTGKELIQYVYSDIEEIMSFFEYAVLNPDVLLEKESLVVIDEANLVMPSRFYDKLDGSVLAFLAESRKLNTDIFFTTQHPARVDKVLRELTEEWYLCRSLGSMLTIKLKMILDNAGQPLEQIGRSFMFRPSRFHGMYDTHYIVGMSEKLKSQTVMSPPIQQFIDNHYQLDTKSTVKSFVNTALSSKKNFFSSQNKKPNVTTG